MLEGEGWPNNLPVQFTSFVGRVREREQVRAALAATRLLTLTGAGGAGKTRLALQVGADASGLFPDGAWWVDLAPVTEPRSVDGALAGVLGVRPLPGRTEVQAAVMRLADDRALVVLDNCEHVLEAVADLTEALIRGCPRVVVLATSREPLGVPGESDWRVPSLSLPADVQLETRELVARSDAGSLFAERAIKVRSDFAVSDENAPAVARICRELDGIPLAIELAAARMRMLSVAEIADGLSDRFRLLTGGARRVVPRQRTLRASVDWSYELLSDPERLLFRRLAVFVGGWSLDAVEPVCSGDGPDDCLMLDLLASLVDKSLVIFEIHDRATRYRMLETVRQYALEVLEESGELPVLRDRHLAFFVTVAERAMVELDVPQNLAWLELLEPETANFDAAIGRGVDADPERVLRIGVGLTAWWELGGRCVAGQDALVRGLDAAGLSRSRLRARALWSCGHLARLAGDWEAAARYAGAALDLAESIGEEGTVSRALITLGQLRLPTDPTGCRPMMARGIELARRTGDQWALSLGLAVLGRAYFRTDELDEAERTFEEAERAVPRAGPDGIRWNASGLAWCAFIRAEHERCWGLCRRAVSAARELGDPVSETLVQVIMVLDETAQGRTQAALERALEAEARARSAGVQWGLLHVRTELARAYSALGHVDRALELLEVVTAGGADSGWLLGRALLLLADVLRGVGEVDSAEAHAGQALALSERLGARSLSAAALELFARLAIGRGEWSEAEVLAHKALALRLEIGATVWLPQSLDPLAQVAAGLESYREAARLLGAAQRARADLSLVRWPPDALAFDQLERALARQLGEEAYPVARAEGAALSLEEAIGWVRRARGTRRRPAGGWESLTPTEVQVVELVSQGLTNPQVAERMFISRATVKAHLAHIFQKLDVGSRSELTALTLRRTG